MVNTAPTIDMNESENINVSADHTPVDVGIVHGSATSTLSAVANRLVILPSALDSLEGVLVSQGHMTDFIIKSYDIYSETPGLRGYIDTNTVRPPAIGPEDGAVDAGASAHGDQEDEIVEEANALLVQTEDLQTSFLHLQGANRTILKTLNSLKSRAQQLTKRTRDDNDDTNNDTSEMPALTRQKTSAT